MHLRQNVRKSDLKVPTYGETAFVGRRLQPRHRACTEAIHVGAKTHNLQLDGLKIQSFSAPNP